MAATVSYPAPPLDSIKRRTVAKYVNEYEGGPKQGGADWGAKRCRTIGGSEMSALDGSSIFKGVRELIESKVGITPWNGDYKTHWGNLFEDVITRYIEIDKNVEIIGTEIWIQGEDPRQSYSPDGLGTMMINYDLSIKEEQPDGTYVTQSVVSPQEKIVLFEFKCPFSRNPGREVPKWYVPQVKTGLNTIPIAEIGLYAEAVFRRCGYADLCDNNGDFIPTFTAKTKCGGGLPISMGIIGFYFDPVESRKKCHTADIRKLMKYYREEETVGVIDAGEAPDGIFECILKAFINGVLIPWYGNVIMRGTNGGGDGDTDSVDADDTDNRTLIERDYDAFFTHCSAVYKPYCVLPWKMFRIDYHFIEEEEGYVDGFLKQINEIMDVVDACLDKPENRDVIIDNHFNVDNYFDD